MNIVNKLTLSHLKTNKSRSVVTVLGITVSVAMITAVFVALVSFINLFGNLTMLADGDVHFKITGLNQTQISQLKDDERLDAIGLYNHNYMTYNFGDEADKNGIGSVSVLNKDSMNILVQSDYEGTLPRDESEIAVQESFIEKNGLDWKVGDVVTVPYGRRYVNIEGNEIDLTNDLYQRNEQFEKQGERQFVLSAILKTNPPISEDMFTLSENISPDDTDAVYLRLSNPGFDSYTEIKDIIKDIKAENNYCIINKDLLASEYAIDAGGTIAELLPIVAIILAIILVASVVLIYNAFAMSLNEKVRYLGMLSSVGATKRQKKNSIYFEGLILGLIGLPLGILSGIAGIGITLSLLGDKIISSGMLNFADNGNLKMNVVVPWWIVLIIAFISFITIFVSCVIPAKKASKITPIDAIRQTNQIKIKAKKLRTPKYIKALFGYEGELAHKNLKRNGRKARVITVSIALSVVLFLCSNYFCNIFVQAADIEKSYPFQITVYQRLNEGESIDDSVYNIIEKTKNVDKFYSTTEEFHEIQKVGEETDFESIRNTEYLTNTYKNFFSKKKVMPIFYIDDNHFNELCRNNNIDSSEYYKSEVKGLILNDISHSNKYNPVFNDKVIGAKLDSTYGFDITVGGLIKYDNNISECNFVSNGALAVFVPYSTFVKTVTAIPDSENNVTISYGIETTQHEQVYDELYSNFDNETYYNVIVSDLQEAFQVMDTIVLVIQVFVYGFISLISLITIFNIINTVSTGIMSRRKEFAMLQSVGITPKGFNRMLTLESAFYGIRALIVSLPLSALISYGMNIALGDESIPFVFDYPMYIVVVLVVMVIIGLTMLYSIKQVRKQNIIETLKDDIV